MIGVYKHTCWYPWRVLGSGTSDVTGCCAAVRVSCHLTEMEEGFGCSKAAICVGNGDAMYRYFRYKKIISKAHQKIKTNRFFLSKIPAMQQFTINRFSQNMFKKMIFWVLEFDLFIGKSLKKYQMEYPIPDTRIQDPGSRYQIPDTR